MIQALTSVPAGWHLDIKRKKIRHIYFRVYPQEKRIGISVPTAIGSHALDQAIQAKMPWILKQVCKPRSNQPKTVQGICTGDVCYFKGDPFVLRVKEGHGPAGADLSLPEELALHVRQASSAAFRRKILSEWYRSQLKAEIVLLLEKWQPKMGVKVLEFGIKEMKTRWGSCNTRAKRIWLNLALIRMTPCFLEYVLVHELVHLLERKHNQRFYAFMDEFIPDWPARKKEMNQFLL